MAKQSERRREVIVGGFVLVGIAVGALMVFLLGREQRIFEDRFVLRAIFGNVSGIRAGAPVFVGGLSVGTVERIEFVAPGQARRVEREAESAESGSEGRVAEIEVVMKVEERFRPQIRRDSVATVGSVGLLGDKSIEISVGTVTQAEVEPGAVLTTVDPLSVTELIEDVQPMAENLDRILGDLAILTGDISSEESTLRAGLESLSNILAKVDRGEGSIGSLINSPETIEEFDALVASAGEAVGAIREATVDLPETMESVRKVADEVEQLSIALRQSAERLPSITREIEEIARNARIASENLPTISTQAQRGVRKASDVLDAAGQSIFLRGNLPPEPERLPVGMSLDAAVDVEEASGAR
jgi:phospholipid/cholesterol/gamma-HCH transport system substrate-binding protein